ncbi:MULTISPECIES: gene transfer agent family protein [unclassified Sphingomonas]|uniref:gene transfer agent family protein n=1 Tax=unclassified Sphingomonas TaxID=196159 RepID=UPI0006FC48CD|nr:MULTISPECIES: gene transfer agent family protein [unclassified Sphingomonas]KQX18422.1 hypothetical protein ASD17_14770 [Sphingomonas sp. Root1294]KQY72253.1 hypothetical protein ASD39_20205 [Sphingomonas sp. Root50]KRB94476.1 hypothetical protein ASE22_00545 [Sphingomonas sp. Root720]
MQISIPLPFADGEYVFALPIKQIVALEAKAGPIDLVKHRLINGGWSVLDVVETIRHGLIGGGRGMVNKVDVSISDLKANLLVDTYIDGKPLAPHAITAKAVLMALYVGYEPVEGQKKSPVTEEDQESSSESTGASSSTTASPSD